MYFAGGLELIFVTDNKQNKYSSFSIIAFRTEFFELIQKYLNLASI
jgi:hypothetical protein